MNKMLKNLIELAGLVDPRIQQMFENDACGSHDQRSECQRDAER